MSINFGLMLLLRQLVAKFIGGYTTCNSSPEGGGVKYASLTTNYVNLEYMSKWWHAYECARSSRDPAILYSNYNRENIPAFDFKFVYTRNEMGVQFLVAFAIYITITITMTHIY